MEGQTRRLTLLALSGVMSFGLMGCLPVTPVSPLAINLLGRVPQDGWLIAQEQTLATYSAEGQKTSEQTVVDGQTIQGAFVRPATGEPIVILKEGETWVVWLIRDGQWTAVYSSKVAFSSCDLAPNGHALVCVQAGDLNLIRFSDQRIQRLDSSVLDAVWSPTNTDILVSYADRVDVLGLDLDDQVATRTLVAEQLVSGAQFVDSSQVVWWTGDDVQRQLQIYSLRSGETTTLWTGVAAPEVWVERQGNRLALSDNRTCDPSCTTQVISLSLGTTLQTAEGVIPLGWHDKELVTAEPQPPVDQDHLQTYHFATLGADQTSVDLGSGVLLAGDHSFHLFFTQ